MQTLLATKDIYERSETAIKPLALSHKPLPGKIIISIPQKSEKTRAGLYISGQEYMTGAEYNYQDECFKVAEAIMKSKDAQYMKKWGQIDKLKKIVRAEVARVPKTANEAQIGADRYNPIHGKVLAV